MWPLVASGYNFVRSLCESPRLLGTVQLVGYKVNLQPVVAAWDGYGIFQVNPVQRHKYAELRKQSKVPWFVVGSRWGELSCIVEEQVVPICMLELVVGSVDGLPFAQEAVAKENINTRSSSTPCFGNVSSACLLTFVRSVRPVA